jgi:hypothetical protein
LRSFVYPYVFHNWFFYFCAKCHWNFYRDCVECIGYYYSYGHIHNVYSTNPWAWKVFASSDIFSYFPLQWFLVFTKKFTGFFH